MSVPPLVIDLVERFRRNEAAYRSGLYNETQVRREFIDPFFECLGCDVNMHTIASTKQGGYFEYKPMYLVQLPIPVLDLSNKTDKNRHDRIAHLAERLLALHQQQTTAATDHERTLLIRQITATDRQIDQLVYTLYGLTDKEIALVEGER